MIKISCNEVTAISLEQQQQQQQFRTVKRHNHFSRHKIHVLACTWTTINNTFLFVFQIPKCQTVIFYD